MQPDMHPLQPSPQRKHNKGEGHGPKQARQALGQRRGQIQVQALHQRADNIGDHVDQQRIGGRRAKEDGPALRPFEVDQPVEESKQRDA